ncbi:CHAP domain-containing protein [Nocardioides alpinus]|uniref:CHAP domain-containing protein n=1 Tax=Nocardioides alpinus TaxID=748909 RepID=A0A1I0YJ87_9ACTN|nr:CHAP domain-containing protein [Nocardioides alpinus]PKH43548.1 CHAP domain-containing protein [Nocardioides alpinus]SFB13251.1 CHAP domain-containing protein [Nocardioides alpinus]
MGNTGIIARALAAACIAAGLLGVSAPAAQAADDYPWAWQGQCPIVPQEPIEEPTPTPTPTPSPTPPKPGEKEAPVVEPPPPPPPPPPVLDPVSGHLYDPRGPKPVCESRVWSINGSIGDSWGFVLRNCTSFVAWRLQERNRMAGFANDFGGEHWGNAENWDDVARRLGYRVDGVPAIGAVAQSDNGRVGHVAWVSAIGPGTVTIEEYNHATPGGYGSRAVPVGDFRYLHLDDVAPSPLIGSDRPVVSVPDGLGESWTARVDDRGTLRLARPGRPARTVGPRGTFSSLVAPALVLDRRGLPWVAATTRTGRVLAGTLRGTGTGVRLRDVGTSAVTASPALALSRTGRPVLAATSSAGTLVTRRFTEAGRWSRAARVGEPLSWATHTAPVLGPDDAGRTVLVAVTARGATFAQTLERGRLRRLPGDRASTTSTPALSLASDGTTRLHQVTAAGRLRVTRLVGRRWSRAETIDGDWSPYASPAVGAVGGRLHVAAVARSGALLVRAAVPGEKSQLPGTIRSSGDATRSPGLVTRSNAGLFVVADRGRTAHARLLTRPTWAVTGVTAPTRAGFTP